MKPMTIAVAKDNTSKPTVTLIVDKLREKKLPATHNSNPSYDVFLYFLAFLLQQIVEENHEEYGPESGNDYFPDQMLTHPQFHNVRRIHGLAMMIFGGHRLYREFGFRTFEEMVVADFKTLMGAFEQGLVDTGEATPLTSSQFNLLLA